MKSSWPTGYIRDEHVQTRLFQLMAGFFLFALLGMVLMLVLFPDAFQGASSSRNAPRPAPESPGIWILVKVGFFTLFFLAGFVGFIAGLIWVITANMRAWEKKKRADNVPRAVVIGTEKENDRPANPIIVVKGENEHPRA